MSIRLSLAAALAIGLLLAAVAAVGLEAVRPYVHGNTPDAGATSERPVRSYEAGVVLPRLEGRSAPPPRRTDAPVRTLHGLVRSEDGAPVAGVRVECVHTRSGAVETLVTATDVDGRFSIGNVPAGYVTLCAFEGLQDHMSEGKVIHTREDGPHVLTIPGWLRLEGQVLSVGAAEAEVHLRRIWCGDGIEDDVRWIRTPGASRTTVTSAGHFHFDHLLPGCYRIRATAPPAAAKTRVVELWRGTRDVNLGCSVPCALEIDCDWTAIIGVRQPSVALERLWNGQPPSPVRFEGLAEGPAQIVVRPFLSSQGGFSAYWIHEVVVSPPVTRWACRVSPEERVRLKVVGPTPLSPTCGLLRLRSESGGVQEFDFELRIDLSLIRWWYTGAGPERFEAGGEDGWLDLPGLSRGRYVLQIEIPSYVTVEQEVAVSGPTDIVVPITRAPGQWVTLPRQDGSTWHLWARASGRAAAAWAPLAGCEKPDLRIQDQMELERAFLLLGTYDFRFTSSACTSAEWGPVVVEDSEAELRLAPPVSAGARLVGRVAVAEPTQVEGLVVHVFAGGQRVWAPAPDKATGVDGGRFEIRGLAPGRYRLSFDSRGSFLPLEVEVGGGDVEVVMPFDATGMLGR